MFTKAVAADWAPHGVTVNAIAPGTFLTDANRRWFSEKPELKQEIEGTIPMGRLGEPCEIATRSVPGQRRIELHDRQRGRDRWWPASVVSRRAKLAGCG